METVPVLISLLFLGGLLALGLPVALSLAVSGIVGLFLIADLATAGSVLQGTSYTAVGRANLVVVPMFVLMGMLTLHSGIAEQLFALAARALKRLPGGMAVATIFASAGFGAVTGSSLASVATIGKLAITQMTNLGYRRSYAAAAVAVSGSLAVLIPPSILLVLYGAVTGESVGGLLLAGIIPGVLSAISLAAFALLLAWRKPALIGRARKVDRDDPTPTSTEPPGDEAPEPLRLQTGTLLRALLAIVAIFTIVIGGIYTGFFTPTESAAVGALVALLLLVAQNIRRPRRLIWKFTDALKETVSLNAMIFLILVGAGVFSYFLVRAGVPRALSELALGLPVPPAVVVIALLLILVPAGMFLDSISLLVITVPLIYQPVIDLGFDGIWLGIMMVKLIELGMITPPIGMNVYVTAGTTPGLDVMEVFKGVIPYYLADVVVIAILFTLPGIVTFLPYMSAAT